MYIHRYRLQKDLSAALNRGYTTSDEIREVTLLYESYRNDLGGNGVVVTLYDHFKELEVRLPN